MRLYNGYQRLLDDSKLLSLLPALSRSLPCQHSRVFADLYRGSAKIGFRLALALL